MSDDAPAFFRGKRLVIFGAGYVGQELARRAREGGAEVTALTRNPEKAHALRAQGVEAVEADLSSEDWHRAIAGGADYGVNCVSSGGGRGRGVSQKLLRRNGFDLPVGGAARRDGHICLYEQHVGLSAGRGRRRD